ncbi:hypothetical protein [Occallatibacter riparius]|uniref:DUF3618 domain-containing protein n=1 Tax=Occallatibacter riparius TaxID=1002689 RepID=A0A9J7BVI1_9BACT|nr:hypothetical protein [Occallatibacter riparius]UWZ86884.1 hypothetical protein MOP44_13260 [Occallatibacter riparius]
MSTMPHMQIENLELRALEERHLLHERANELKTKLAATRETLDVEKQARKHFGPAALIVAGVGLVSGFAFAGIFTER